jgi:hypothetical protein
MADEFISAVIFLEILHSPDLTHETNKGMTKTVIEKH